MSNCEMNLGEYFEQEDTPAPGSSCAFAMVELFRLRPELSFEQARQLVGQFAWETNAKKRARCAAKRLKTTA